MGSIRARQKGWRVARGSASSSVCLSLGVSILGAGPEGPCHCQPPPPGPQGNQEDLLCVWFVIFCLQLEAILQRVIVLLVSDSPSRASSGVRQALLACMGTCGRRPSWPQVPFPVHSKPRGVPAPRGVGVMAGPSRTICHVTALQLG